MTAALPPPDAARAASFRRYLREAQRRHRRRTGYGSRYEIAIAALWFGSGLVAGTWHELVTPAPADPLLTWPAGTALLAVVVVLIGAVAARFGPVAASAAWAEWVLSTPLDRGPLLRGSLWRATALAAASGFAAGALVAVGTGLTRVPLVGGALLGSGAGVAACAIAGVRQWSPHRRGRRWPVVVAALAALAALLNLATVAPLDQYWLWVAVAAALVGGLAAFGVAAVGVARVPVATLTSSASAVSVLGFAAAEQSLDGLGPARDGHRRRPTAQRKPLTGTGGWALLAVERRRLWRNGSGLVRWVMLAVTPYAALALVHGAERGPGLVAVSSLLAGTAAISGLAGTARTFAADPLVAATLGLDPAGAQRIALLVPVSAGVAWGAVVAPALVLGGPVVMAVLVPVTAIALVLHRVTRGAFRPTFRMGSQYSIDLIQRFVRGPGPLLLACVGYGWLAITLR